MALARRRGGIQASIWPGFVDAMTALLLVLMFVLTIFMVVQAVLRETITGQADELNELGAEVSALSQALGLASSQRDAMEIELGTLRATIQTQGEALAERDSAIADFETQVAALLAQRTQAQDRIAALEAEGAEVLSQKQALDLALASARSEIDAQTEAARLAAAQREALEALIADLEVKNDEAAKELTAAEAARLTQSQAAAALRERLANAQDELTAATLALEAKRKEAEDTLTLLAATQDTRDDLDARLAQALLDVDAKNQELAELSTQAQLSQQEVRAELTAALAARLQAEQDAADRLSEADERAALLAQANLNLETLEARSAEDQRKLALLNEQIAALRAQLSSLQGVLDAAAQADRDADIQIQTLGADLNAALARAAAEERKRRQLEEAERKRLEAQAQDLERYRSEFFGQLRALLDGQEGVRIEGDRFVFSSEVLFGAGQADLSNEGRGEIAKVATILRAIADDIPEGIDWVIRVDGHTDNVPLSGQGAFADNWELSQARALSVVRYMVNFLAIPPDRLAANGFGQYQPVNPANTPAARAQNRRIELKLTEK